MKREGRQRGMVRTFPILSPAYIPRPSSKRNANELTAGLFTKASSKPTNHSKFTGKCCRPNCRDCHIEPACKSKDKAKGTHKTPSPSVDVGLISWSAAESTGQLKVSGFSASGVLDYLDDSERDIDDEEDLDGGDADECYDNMLSLSPHLDGMDDDNDDNLSFIDLELVCESMDGDDEGWCLVEDIL